MFKIIKRIAAGRELQKGSKSKKMDNAFSKDSIEKYYPYLKSIKTDRPELLIVEGDSAAGPAIQARDEYNQALYIMTGKPKNVYDMQAYKISRLQTAFNDIVDILGCGIGRTFDISKMKFDKIIGQTDADIDGDGMWIALVSLINKFMPPLIKLGFVYRNTPPLYKFEDKGKDNYAVSQKELYKYLNKKFIDKYKIERDGYELKDDLVYTLLTINFEYVSIMNDIASRFNCDARFAEKLVYSYNYNTRNKSPKKQLAAVKKEFKDHTLLDIRLEDDVIVLEGTANTDEYIFIMLNHDFLRRTRKIQKMQSQSWIVYGYTIDDKKNLSLYSFMKAFEKIMPKDIQRYKGFGELNADMVQLLCLDRDNRTLIRFKSNNIEKELTLLNTINSSKTRWMEARKSLVSEMNFSDLYIDT